jgi:hypothetical protein
MNLHSLHPYYLIVSFLPLKRVCKRETLKVYNWKKKIDIKCHTKGKIMLQWTFLDVPVFFFRFVMDPQIL